MNRIVIILFIVLSLFGTKRECKSELRETGKQVLPAHFARMHKLHDEKGLFCKICHKKEKRYPEYALIVPQYSSLESPGPGYVDKSICLHCHRKDGEAISDEATSFYGVDDAGD